MKFKVGDRVRVREDLTEHKTYHSGGKETWEVALPSMVKMRGQIVTIKKVYSDSTYLVEEDNHFWADEMFEDTLEFKVGDRVKVVREEPFESHILGKVGTVKKYCHENKNLVAVVFDDNVNGHNLLGICKYGHGWFCKVENLERITNNKDKIVITSDGKKVTAKLYNDKELIKSAEAKCCPDDKFNFEFGATLAMGRLFEHESDSDKVKPKELLKNGMFGKHKNFGWFVVVDNKFIYFDGGHSGVGDYNDDLTSKYFPKKDYVEILVYAPNLNSAKISAESNGSDIIWKR